MREEYVLGKLSKYYTFITFALIIEAVALSFCDTSNKQTKDAPAVEVEKNPIPSIRISQESEDSIAAINNLPDTVAGNKEKANDE